MGVSGWTKRVIMSYENPHRPFEYMAPVRIKWLLQAGQGAVRFHPAGTFIEQQVACMMEASHGAVQLQD